MPGASLTRKELEALNLDAGQRQRVNRQLAGAGNRARPTLGPEGRLANGKYRDGQGRVWDSLAEARVYLELVGRKARGEVAWFTWQVPFELASPAEDRASFRGRTYVADFLVGRTDGRVEAWEVKGTDPKKRLRHGDEKFQQKRVWFAQRHGLRLRLVVR